MSGPPQEPKPRDWLAEAHIIARSAPALGNPLDLFCAEFDRHLILSLKGYESSNAAPTDSREWARRYVERSI